MNIEAYARNPQPEQAHNQRSCYPSGIVSLLITLDMH